jgi:tRNA (guanine37-N1)-methyltransferase
MRVDIFSLFPQVFGPYLEISILQRAIQNRLVEIHNHNIRDWTPDRHHTTDDVPYGGGGGMVMKVEPVFAAVEEILGNPPICPLILMTPQGRVFDQKAAYELSGLDHLAILCGRYEGIDERIRENLVTDEISVGDYVLTGGELPALTILDAIVRLIPGALGDPDGAQDDSHASGLLEYPHYTRPPEFRGYKVPEVLLSGHHAEIARWRREQAIKRTLQRRPDMLEKAELSEKENKYLKQLIDEE